MLAHPVEAFSDSIPKRVVSLIPSVTESLFSLGLGAAVVGVTDYCTHPAENVAKLPKIGGPKNPRTGEIIALAPDLVIASKDENLPETVQALVKAGIRVWVTHPCSVQDALEDLRTMTELFRSERALLAVQQLERSLEWEMLAAAERPCLRAFCPVWQETLVDGETWWMTFNDQTYPGDLLRVLNVENVFGKRARRYPLMGDLGRVEAEDPAGRDTRYPRVTREEVMAGAPELILLPDEPYAYSQKDVEGVRQLLAGTPAAETGRILRVEGRLLMWHGTRLGEALAVLPAMLGGVVA